MRMTNKSYYNRILIIKPYWYWYCCLCLVVFIHVHAISCFVSHSHPCRSTQRQQTPCYSTNFNHHKSSSSSSFTLLMSTRSSSNNVQRGESVSMMSSFWYVRESSNATSIAVASADLVVDPTEYYSGAAVPYDPYLDLGEGMLMPNAYRSFPSLLNENLNSRCSTSDKQACLMTVGIDLERKPMFDSSELDAEDIVNRLQTCIDYGFNSFQISNSDSKLQEWGEINAFGVLRRNTPASVMRKCVIASRIELPRSGPFDPQYIRDQVSTSLIRTRSECIDVLQLSYNKESPYYLDAINTIIDLKREGKILSLGGINMPLDLLRDISTQFGDSSLIDTNQVSCNVIDQRSLNSMQPYCNTHACKMFSSNSNMGGLLRKNYLEYTTKPKWSELSPSERKNLRLVRKWANKKTEQESWQIFREKCLIELQAISDKYQASIEDVSLRWAMEVDALGSVIVNTNLVEEDCTSFPIKLRNAFRIKLDSEDQEVIKKISQTGTTGVKQPNLDLDYEEHFMLKNKKLWLL